MNEPGKILEALTDEQKKKIKNAKNPEELLAIAKETGYELSQEQLNDLSGGKWDCRRLDECSYYSISM